MTAHYELRCPCGGEVDWRSTRTGRCIGGNPVEELEPGPPFACTVCGRALPIDELVASETLEQDPGGGVGRAAGVDE